MKKIVRSALVPYTPEQMFDLVDAIETYPEFVPFCQDAREVERDADAVVATLAVAKGGFSKEFTTRNSLQRPGSIIMNLVAGPFRQLRGEWRFTPLSEVGCKVELEVEFEFSSLVTNLAFRSVFSQLAESFVTAFSERARQVYGEAA